MLGITDFLMIIFLFLGLTLLITGSKKKNEIMQNVGIAFLCIFGLLFGILLAKLIFN